MSTCNFRTMKDFPLMAMSDYDLCRNIVGDKDWEGNPIEEYGDMDLDIAYEWLHNEFADIIDDLNDKLEWYEVSVKSGYYNGIQLYVENAKTADLEEWTDGEEDIEEMEYWYDVHSKAELVVLVEREKALITEFMNTEAKSYGFEELICLGVFSNGEAIYEYKDRLKDKIEGK